MCVTARRPDGNLFLGNEKASHTIIPRYGGLMAGMGAYRHLPPRDRIWRQGLEGDSEGVSTHSI